MILYVAWSNILVSSVCHSSVASTRAKPTGFLARLAAISKSRYYKEGNVQSKKCQAIRR